MLVLVLALVVVAFGLLVTALATSTMLWAWFSVAASVVAAITLAVDWRQRRRRSATAPSRPSAPVAPPLVESERELVAAPTDDLDLDAEPAEEDTDAADVLTVSELEAEVLVVDERPRYHLATCRWLNNRATLPLPVREARELGFTPCSVCAPDSALAAAHR
jgi:hypothetical protein